MSDRICRCGKSRILPRTGHDEPLRNDVRADPSFSSALHPYKLFIISTGALSSPNCTRTR